MGLQTDLEAYFSSSDSAPSVILQQTNKANSLVNDIIGPWLLGGRTGPPTTSSFKPLAFNVAGLPLVLGGMTGPPFPIVPNPNTISIEGGINLLMTGMLFPPGTPYLPGSVGNTGPNISISPTVPFSIPPVSNAPPAAVAIAWATKLTIAAASVLVSGIDLAPGTPPIPIPFAAPFLPASV